MEDAAAYSENFLLAAVVVSFAMVVYCQFNGGGCETSAVPRVIGLILSQHAQHSTGMQLSDYNCIKTKEDILSIFDYM